MRFLFAETCQSRHSEATRHRSLSRVVGKPSSGKGNAACGPRSGTRFNSNLVIDSPAKPLLAAVLSLEQPLVKGSITKISL